MTTEDAVCRQSAGTRTAGELDNDDDAAAVGLIVSADEYLLSLGEFVYGMIQTHWPGVSLLFYPPPWGFPFIFHDFTGHFKSSLPCLCNGIGEGIFGFVF